MYHRRVFILTSQTLFAQGVQSLLSGHPGINVVGAAVVGSDLLDQVREAAPDVIIVEAELEEQGRLVTKLMECTPGARVIGLTLEDNRLHIYYQQTKESRGVDDLFEAIREPLELGERRLEDLRLLVLFQGHYGKRILENVKRSSGESWTVNAWRASSALPLVVDDPLAFLPMHLPRADLVLSLGESPSAAQLVPSIVERTGARAAIAPVDNASWLPPGLARQLRTQLREIGVTAVFPKPFCSLTEHCYNVRQHEVSYDDPWIAEFARRFGRPVFEIECDEQQVRTVEVERDSACGCAQAVARQLVGVEVQEAVQEAGLLHHHYPCLATMRVDPGLGEPLIQASGDLMRRAVEVEIASHLPGKAYLVPEGHTEER